MTWGPPEVTSGCRPGDGQGAGPPSNCCDAAHPTLHNVGISTVRGLDIAYRCCDPDRHIIGASGHVSGNARRSREKPAPPFVRLGEICPSACGIAVGRIEDVLNAPFSWAHWHLRLPFVVALSGCALLGCAHSGQQGSSTTTKPIPLPSLALLTQYPEPGCELKASELNGHKGRAEGVAVRVANLPGERSHKSAGSDGPTSVSGTTSQPNRSLARANPDASLAERIRLEYERNCFQRAEVRVREKLMQLQIAVRKTVRAIEGTKRTDR